MRRLILVTAALLPACAQFWRVVDDPSRVCLPGHVLTPEGCVPRDVVVTPAPPPVPTPTPCPGQPGGVPCPPGEVTQYESTHGVSSCWCGTPVPPYVTPTPTSTPPAPPTVAPTSTPIPQPTAAPTPFGHCMLPDAPWTRPGPPPFPVPVLGTFGERCEKGFRRVGPDRDGELGCVIDWTCAPGTNGRSPAEGAQISLAGNHVVIDSEGYLRDVDNGRPCGMDAWGRKVCAGEIREPLWEDRPEKWWAQFAACDPVACGPEATPTPAGPTPTPNPIPTTGEACVAADGSGCTVVCTVAFLGWNDRPGLPPGVEVGGEARLDVTCRRATQPGDSRGQPVDRFGPEHCEPNGTPVLWIVHVPGSVNVREFNDGYGLALSDLQPGEYRIEVLPNKSALDRKGQPITWCGWGHGSSTRTVLEFGL